MNDTARSRLDERLSSKEEVSFAWPVILAFLRITTHPGLFPRPLSIQAAIAKVEAWLTQPVARLLDPSPDNWRHFSGLPVQAQCTGNLVQDAHLAALTIEFGATVCSTDADFSRFPNLN